MAKKAPQPQRGGNFQPRQGFRPLTEAEEVTPDPQGNRAQRRAAARAAKKGQAPAAEPATEETESTKSAENTESTGEEASPERS